MIRTIVAGLFILFLPGFSMVNAIFPVKGELDGEMDILYRIAYGVGISIALTVIIGFVLGTMPSLSNETGHFTSSNLWMGFISLTVGFFIIGWYRGAYQRLKYIHPSLARPQRSKKEDHSDIQMEREYLKRLQQLKKEQMCLKENIRDIKKKMKKVRDDEKKKLSEEKEKYEDEMERVEERLKELEKKVEERF